VNGLILFSESHEMSSNRRQNARTCKDTNCDSARNQVLCVAAQQLVRASHTQNTVAGNGESPRLSRCVPRNNPLTEVHLGPPAVATPTAKEAYTCVITRSH
jgi:hypothetical protein